MLVLTRRPGEDIIIDGKIRITITSVKGDRIRIGIDAPPSVAVDRQEVYQRRRDFPDPDLDSFYVQGGDGGAAPVSRRVRPLTS